jgi:hypothetical protein
MKPAPPPEVPGATEAARFDHAVRALLSTPKSAYLAEESRLKDEREHRKKRGKKRS